MCYLTFNNISGTPPFDVFISDQNGNNRTFIGQIPTSVPPSVVLTLPPLFATAPTILIEIIDVSGCTETEIIIVNPPTPTPDLFALLFIEPKSRSSQIYNYLIGEGNTTFFGFGYGTPPLNGFEFTNYMRMFATSGITGLPNVIYQIVPQSTGGNDSFNNPKVQYNFETTIVSGGTISEDAWYTWVIPTALTNNQKQTQISYGNQNSPYILSSVIVNSVISDFVFNYTGSTYANNFYRIYTTYPSTEFYLNNLNTDIYFRGLIVE
jgi:hypothetical protein